jgi:hypothetical protein
MNHLLSTLSGEMLSSGIGWVASILAFGVFLGFLYVIGQTGTTVRRGFEIKKALRKAEADARRNQQTIDRIKVRRLNSKATKMIVWPIALWVVVYGCTFWLCPLSFALWSLLLLVAPALGFFGMFFMPDIGLD